jgi:hypothetical protein
MNRIAKVGDWAKQQRWQIAAVLGLIILVAIAYGRLIHGYFATDEWWAFSFAIANPNIKTAIMPSGVYTPSANLFIYALYYLFGLNAAVWAWLTLIVHTASTITVYFLGRRLSGRSIIGFIAAALFAAAPMGSQFIDQFSMLPTSAMATLFGFLCLLAYAYRRTILAAIFFFIALSFSAYAVPFIILAGLVELAIMTRKKWWKTILRFLPMIAGFGLYYYVLSITTFKATQLHDRPVVSDHGLFEHLRVILQKMYQGYGEVIVYRSGTIDPHAMLSISNTITAVAVLAIVALLIKREYRLAKTALIGYLWIPASLSLFSNLNTVALDAVFPNRYFYVTVVGIGLFIGSVVFGLFDWSAIKKKTKWKTVLPQVAVTLAALGLLIFYTPKTRSIVEGEVKLGASRKMILDTIVREVPTVGRDAIFCFTSNTGHYGSPPDSFPLPFAHNFGFNLAVTYRAKSTPLRVFFTESGYFVNPAASFYYFSRDQKDPDGIGPGIGFATSVDKCLEVKSKYAGHVGIKDYYGFAYDGTKPELTNITPALRRVLAGETVEPKELYPWQ